MALLWVVALLNYLDRQVIFSVLPLVKSDLKMSDVELGLLGAVFVWVYGILSPVAGYLGDRFGRVRIVTVSLLVWSAVTWATGLARTPGELLLARGLMGISEACYLPAALALISDFHTDRSRSLATGLHFSGIYFGMVVGGVGGGWMGEQHGWRAAFTFLGAFGIVYTLAIRFGLRESAAPRAAAAPFLASMKEVVRLPGFATLALVFSTTSIANWIVYTWLPFYLYERFGMSLTAAGFTATFYIQVGSVAGILLGGRLADAWSRRSGSGRLYTQALGLSAAAPFLFLAGSTSAVGFLIAGLLVFGLGRGMFDCNAMPVLAQIARPDLRATGYGIYNCLGCIVGGTMAALAGVIKSTLGLTAAFQLAAVILFVSAVVLGRLRLASPAAGSEAKTAA